jgi:uncharacterized protein (TIGR04255 family)
MPFTTPLEEAVAEVNFAPSALLEFRAATLYSLIGAEFPNYQKFPFFLVPVEAGGGAAPPYSPAYRFTSEDGKQMVQFGPRTLTFNSLAYGGWPRFMEQFSRVFHMVAEASFGLVGERLALTFVNRMPVDTPQGLQKLLCIDLGIDEKTVPLDFMIRKIGQHEAGLSTTIITPLPPDEMFPTPAFGITCTEIGFGTDEFNATNLPEILSWFENAHGRSKDRFWNLLTPEIQKEWEATYAARSAS